MTQPQSAANPIAKLMGRRPCKRRQWKGTRRIPSLETCCPYTYDYGNLYCCHGDNIRALGSFPAWWVLLPRGAGTFRTESPQCVAASLWVPTALGRCPQLLRLASVFRLRSPAVPHHEHQPGGSHHHGFSHLNKFLHTQIVIFTILVQGYASFLLKSTTCHHPQPLQEFSWTHSDEDTPRMSPPYK